jgi:hypothetical protein
MNLNKMSRFGLIVVIALPLCSGYGQSLVAPTSSSTVAVPAPNINFGSPATNLPSNAAEIVRLSSAGLGDDVVLAFVNTSKSLYSLSANDILQLKDLGVSQTVLVAMLKHDSSLRIPNPPGQPNYNNNQPLPPANPAPIGQTVQQPGTSVNPYQLAPATTVVVAPAPPTQVEYIPAAPAPDYYWAPGYWGWNDGWVWIGGSWNLGVGYGWGWGGYRGWGGHYGGYRGSGAYHGGGGFRGGHR